MGIYLKNLLEKTDDCHTIYRSDYVSGQDFQEIWAIPDNKYQTLAKEIGLDPNSEAYNFHYWDRKHYKYNPLNSLRRTVFQRGGKGRKTRTKRTKRSKQSKKRRSTRRR